MRLHVPGLIVAAMTLAGAPASAQVRITLAQGRVTLSAKDVTVRQILTEWALAGQTRIVNLDRLPGTPLSLELTDVPEEQALETVLRSVSGYVAVPRASKVANASRYDRIFLLASSSGTAARPAAPLPSPPSFAPPPLSEEPPAVDEDEPRQPAAQQNATVPTRGPGFAPFPQPPLPPPAPSAQAAPGQDGGAFVAPSSPVGVATPGMVVPVPQPAAPRTTER